MRSLKILKTAISSGASLADNKGIMKNTNQNTTYLANAKSQLSPRLYRRVAKVCCDWGQGAATRYLSVQREVDARNEARGYNV